MSIEKRYLTRSDCYNSSSSIVPNSIELHTIGTAQPSADALANYWDNPNIEACVHYCVDASKLDRVLQFLPETKRSWADAGYGNNNSITVELMETDAIMYTSGAKYLTSDLNTAIKHIKTAYNTAVELFADICNRYGWNPHDRLPNGLYRIYSHQEAAEAGLASSHVDPTHIWPLIGKTMDDFRRDVSNRLSNLLYCHPQATDITGSEEERAAKLLGIVTPIAESYSLFPSVATAQCILESGYCSTDLAIKANNLCGMKATLSGNTWEGSTWDGMTVYTKETAEQDANGSTYYVTADFRAYPCIVDSIADRCAYLLGAMNGDHKRYEGITKCENYVEQINLIKDGGYATDVAYTSKIISIIRRFGLDKYDKATADNEIYRVRLTPPDGTMETQIGAYSNLESAMGLAKSEASGYKVYNTKGEIIFDTGKTTAADRIRIACDWAVKIANDDSHGYDNGNRGGNPDYACSSFVNQAWREAGLADLDLSKDTYTADMYTKYLSCGFKDVTASVNVHSGEGINAGDVLLVPGSHVEICVDSNHSLAGARGNAYTGKPENGLPGDQTGGEIAVSGFWDDNWKYVLRYAPDSTRYWVQCNTYASKDNATAFVKTLQDNGFNPVIRRVGEAYMVRLKPNFAVKEKAEKKIAKLRRLGLCEPILKEF